MELVKARECGECTVCCVVLNLDTPEFQKLPRVPCPNLGAGGGCAIHATLPPVCRAYFCGWRRIAKLGDEWRPDRSGILIDFQTDGLPDEYPARPGVRFMVTGAVDALFKPELLFYMAKLVETGVPVILAIPGPVGHFPAGAILNALLKAPVAARDLGGVEMAVKAALKGLESHQFAPVVQRHGTPKSGDAGLQHPPGK